MKKINFYLRYQTKYGQSLLVSGNTPALGNSDTSAALSMKYINDEFWQGSIELPDDYSAILTYCYLLREADGSLTPDWENVRTIDVNSIKSKEIQTVDTWNSPGAVENAFTTQPFSEVLLRRDSIAGMQLKVSAKFTHEFRAKAPLLAPHEVLCVAGSGRSLTDWNTAKPLLMSYDNGWWRVRTDLSRDEFPLSYKYGVYDLSSKKFVGFEEGNNRILYDNGIGRKCTILHDGFARFAIGGWRGAGVAIPVFSLRSAQGFGVGEFTDLPALIDWATSVGLKLIQLLPINDTTATHTWVDSYPYAAISAFALHPQYLNLDELAGVSYASLLAPYAEQRAALNALQVVDYDAVMAAKWEVARKLYVVQKADFAKDAEWLAYFETNKHWLMPYAVFCYLRDLNGTPDYNQWPEHSTYNEAVIAKLVEPKSKIYDAIAVHYFVQYHLHRQLLGAVQYAHKNGIVLKGDIPIGIYRYSCDAWVAPDLYFMHNQAGAPPDDFAANGQNWGFPTYNWPRMMSDGFLWWRQRFEQMSYYFDAFRIDHILGFFRIWSIPLHAVQGILGYFSPAIPVSQQEFWDKEIGFDYHRFCRPYITTDILNDLFGTDALTVRDHFMEGAPYGGYQFRAAYDTQRKIETAFAAGEDTDANRRIRDGLYELHANVLLIDDHGALHFRIGMEKTRSFAALPNRFKEQLKALYVNYFYRRQDDFWRTQAMEKLPALKRSTNMLICGEDLGMVPDCVPGVMEELGFLSLEIQRMPKKSGSTFFHPNEAPYLSVVTPGTHDMSTIRGWWEEDRALTQRFFSEILGQHGTAPFYCEPWINRAIISQHLFSPAMWAIFQLQDLLGSDGFLRRQNPNDERINVPANPKHHWQYRMHMPLTQLQKSDGFNTDLRNMVLASGRG